MNAEPTDDDTMLSTAEYHMVECVAITGHLLTRGQLRHQAEGQLLPFASIGTSRQSHFQRHVAGLIIDVLIKRGHCGSCVSPCVVTRCTTPL